MTWQPASSPHESPEDFLRRCADDWLGSHRSLEDLETWEQHALMAEIEADLLDLHLVPVINIDESREQV